MTPITVVLKGETALKEEVAKIEGKSLNRNIIRTLFNYPRSRRIPQPWPRPTINTLYLKNQVRGFAQLECWNNGIMGSGIMQYWVNGKICFDDKIKNG